ncbi:MAG TPA: hypothetical protein VKZ69_07600 [Limnochordales bacterium]|nr:hypothetical protein [Limnochordales bacterium]
MNGETTWMPAPVGRRRGGPAGRARERKGAFPRFRCWRAAVVLAVALAAVAAKAPAGQAAVMGTTGLLQIPTADVSPPGAGRLAAGVDGSEFLLSVMVSPLPGLEVGGAARSRGAVAPQLKYAVAAESAGAPGFAVGLAGDSYYAVLSRRLSSPGLRLHLGVGAGRWGPVLAGVEARLRSVAVTAADAGPSAPAVSLLVDFDGRAVALGARLQWPAGWTAAAGVRAGHGLVGQVAYGIHF